MLRQPLEQPWLRVEELARLLGDMSRTTAAARLWELSESRKPAALDLRNATCTFGDHPGRWTLPMFEKATVLHGRAFHHRCLCCGGRSGSWSRSRAWKPIRSACLPATAAKPGNLCFG